MKRAIIAFRAPIVSIEAKFKLGQDERDEVYSDIVAGLGSGRPRRVDAEVQRQRDDSRQSWLRVP